MKPKQLCKLLTEIAKEEPNRDGGSKDAQIYQLIGRHVSADRKHGSVC